MINWKRVFLNLRREIGSSAKVAEALEVHIGTVENYIYERVDIPRFDFAMRVLDLHFDRCGDRHSLEDIQKQAGPGTPSSASIARDKQ